MAASDADEVIRVVEAANADAERRAGRPVNEPNPDDRPGVIRAVERFVTRDGPGAWVAEAGGTVVGMAESIRRDGFWGLSMLFVHPDFQSKGVGAALLQAASGYAEGASRRMIISSSDPRAMRRYWRAGLRLHPGVAASGEVDRRLLPKHLPGRTGDASDLALVADVDEGLRGSRAEDVEFGLTLGTVMEVVDEPGGRGFAMWRRDRLQMLGATDEETASILLWRFLAAAQAPVSMSWLTGDQRWAIDVAMAAGLSFQPQGAIFVDGMPGLPVPWVPSGWYF